MLNRAVSVLGLWLVCAAAIAGAPEQERVGLFKNVTGTIRVVRNDGAVKAAPGTELFRSDKVVSEAGASGGIVFIDGTLLTVGPATEMLLRDYAFDAKASRFAFSLYLAKGTAIYSSGKIGKLAPESVSVDTPRATVGVRGTRFMISADD